MSRSALCLLTGSMILALACGCGSDGGERRGGPITDPTGSGDTNMSARIDGVAWESDPLPSGMGVVLVAPGFYFIEGAKVLSGSNASFVTLNLANIRGTGTYPLGVTPTVSGGLGQLGDATAGWSTPLTGTAGSVTISTLTANRIAGTFTFAADSIFGAARGRRMVTEGAFDYPVYPQGSIGELPEQAGGYMRGTLGGSAWNAATAFANRTEIAGATYFIVSTSNDDYSVAITIGQVAGAGEYVLNNTTPLVMINVSSASGSSTWGGSITFGEGGTVLTNDTGSITITSVSSTRVKGTFAGTLAPGLVNPGSGSLVITNGEFDLGFPQFP